MRESIDLVDRTKRDFLRLSLALPTLVLPYEVDAQESRRNKFRRSTPYNIKSISVTAIPQSKKDSELTAQERLELENGIAQKYPFFKGRQPQFIESYKERIVRLEPDGNYAERLIVEARKSIEDIINFLQSDYIKPSNVVLTAPSSPADVIYANQPHILFYLVADFGTRTTTNLRFNIDGKIFSISFIKEELAGSNDATIGETQRTTKFRATESGFNVEGTQSEPIFYNTSANPIKLTETPPIEMLHRAMEPYTLNNIKSAVKNIGRTYKALDQALNRNIAMEEKFVHALSVLWWARYNKQLRYPQQELEARFNQYELVERYKGTRELSQRISRIGIPKAIEMYVKNLSELFKGIPS
ncbi:MAG TPA: hypothetical protein VJJ52_04825 [Candidatus Nanoarchaeia archaeon]|nr:hypothetical protein [Candidatus Nanoarchaeia archaeon]